MPEPLWETNSYRIINEDGTHVVQYQELMRSHLIEQIRDFAPTFGRNKRRGIILGRTIATFDPKYIIQTPSAAEWLADAIKEWNRNPLQFFNPSGDGGRGFVNDLDSKVCLLRAANQSGKSSHAIIKCLLSSVTCERDWPIFTEHGVTFRPLMKEPAGFASYKWEHIKEVIAPEILKWAPLNEAYEWISKTRGGRGKSRSWDDAPTLVFQSGGIIRFQAFNQDQTSFESAIFRRGFWWDEQPPKPRWEGANERIRTSRIAQHNHSFTPHVVEGMEEATGAGTFLHDMWHGDNLMGYSRHQVSTYQIHRMFEKYDTTSLKEAEEYLKAMKAGEVLPGSDVPDWIFPDQSKIEAYEQHIVQPLRTGDRRAFQSGRSRTFGVFEAVHVVLFPEWDEKVHVVESFPVPYQNATLYRYMDHGSTSPCACLWGFVPKPGLSMVINGKKVTFPDEPVLVIYREYYKADRVISENAEGIVEASGNTIRSLGKVNIQGDVYERKEEQFVKEKYRFSKGDMGSLGKRSAESRGVTVQKLYAIHGLNLLPTTRRLRQRRNGEGAEDILKDFIKPDYSRPHILYPEQMGFSRLMVFSNCVNLRNEMRDLVDVKMLRKMGMKGKREQQDHAADALMYLIGDSPVYIEGSSTVSQADDDDEDWLDTQRGTRQALFDPYTGYRL